MRKSVLFAVIVFALTIGGCDKTKEHELQAQLDKNQSDRMALQDALKDREEFVDQILKSVNDIYADLETAGAKEKKLMPGEQGSAEIPWVSSKETRQGFLKTIDEIGNTLKDNRKKINDLQARVRSYRGEVKNLTALLDKLKATLQEREESIAQLRANVEGLQKTVAEQTALVGEKEKVIDEQKKTMNTVYYVAGKRKDLEERGILTEEGGFLWGLLGSTTTLARDVNLSEFTPLDKTVDQTIHVPGRIEDILPHRKIDYYATVDGENSSEIKILRPERFWQANTLVVGLD